ncbi:5'-methylthioadenosine phosphorylase [Halioglobus japonicus]|uniref:Probable 6-oxopurine nucleoside phosphorylase n=1 Tax=Halioglobus japonicus TaxID=930805 RepID=A0AAP8MFG2_9GAMM|nr:S-methyl-5'-thioinosine phosphorylase [Halioglobus japonicus]AQA18750.1 5'-methylthioadenosine phosphorylase [Halioglobus japonicus]PLW86780.1 S-methyl-5'-thioinosine phosphorylase [Halioglobus japonicus]GHD11104.1 S-methyl-5'-thioinosine phosphorylase [Halioglobus japonicus]
MSALAVIGGTGVDRLGGLDIVTRHAVDTPFGEPSQVVQEGRLGDTTIFFLHRHGSPRAIPPHRVNYRANLWALQQLGATHIIGINAVGGIAPSMPPGRLVIPDQVIDYTWGREHTYDTGESGELMHIDFTEPYDAALRNAVLEAADRGDIACARAGVHGVTQGPRLETAAEIRRMASDGCDVVGMTGMPEASLARELGVAYASICMVVNAAAGLDDKPLTLDMMRATLEREADVVASLVEGLCRSSRWAD